MGKGTKLIIIGIVLLFKGVIFSVAFPSIRGEYIGLFIFIIGIFLLIIGVIVIIKNRVSRKKNYENEQKQESYQIDDDEKDPLDILKKRLALGEISKEEFDEIKKDLT